MISLFVEFFLRLRNLARFTLPFGCVFLGACGHQQDEVRSNAPAARHVIVIVIDTLRADHLPLYGYEKNTAPFLTEIAAESMVFSRAVSTSSFTAESISSLFTGRYPSATSWGGGWYARPAPDVETLAETFKKAGYATALFSNSPVLDAPEFYQGFDTTYCFTEFGVSGQDYRLVEKARAWLADHQDEKTFTYLHFLDPHSPYTPPDEYRLRFGDSRPERPLGVYEDVRENVPELRASGFGPGDPRFDNLVERYDGEIALTDDNLRNFFRALVDLGIADDTLSIITADHGEEFLDHGFVEHAWTLFPEAHRIPMLFWQPGRIAPGTAAHTVSLVDILPTLAELQELPSPPGVSTTSFYRREADGRWNPVVNSEPRVMELLIQSRNIVRAVVTDDTLYLAYWKWMSPEECSESTRTIRAERAALIEGQREPLDTWGPIVREELYDLKADPGAQNNQAQADPEALARWRAYLLEYGATCPPQLPDRFKATRDLELLDDSQRALLRNVAPEFLAPVVPDTSHEEALETLGYL